MRPCRPHDLTIDLGNAQAGMNVGDITPVVTGNLIGGASPALRYVISGNNNGGGIILDSFALSTVIQGNLIGTTIDGTSPLGNTGSGISITEDANTIGGAAGAGNTIAFNTSSGVVVASTGTGNSIRSNSIFSKGTLAAHLGIDLGNNGVTGNDTGDGDLGANNLQNFPVITSAASSISGTFNSSASGTFTLQFFLNPTADTSGFGEGRTFLGETGVTTNGSGNATFSFTPPLCMTFGHFVTATATAADGSTSEFSQGVLVLPSYEGWACFNGIEGEPRLGDFDLDGIVNLTEYALGLNPTRACQLPSLTPAGANFQPTIPKGPDATLDPGILYKFQTSTNLINWSTPPLLPTSQNRTQAVFLLPAGPSRGFVRLVVESL